MVFFRLNAFCRISRSSVIINALYVSIYVYVCLCEGDRGESSRSDVGLPVSRLWYFPRFVCASVCFLFWPTSRGKDSRGCFCRVTDCLWVCVLRIAGFLVNVCVHCVETNRSQDSDDRAECFSQLRVLHANLWPVRCLTFSSHSVPGVNLKGSSFHPSPLVVSSVLSTWNMARMD